MKESLDGAFILLATVVLFILAVMLWSLGTDDDLSLEKYAGLFSEETCPRDGNPVAKHARFNRVDLQQFQPSP